jgi:hypothetical protein
MKREDFKNDYDFLKALEDNADEMPTRLDKVLSKFEKSKYEKMLQIDLCIIVYKDKKFYLGTWYEGLEIEISLDTVESLLKDLEELK